VSRLHIVHTTHYTYARTVSASYNEARMRPANLPGQTVLESRLTATPSTFSTEYRDYWGATVTAFETLTAHDELVVVSESRVDVSPVLLGGATAGWDTLHAPDLVDRMSEFLAVTTATEPDEELRELARAHADGATPQDAALAVCRALREAVEYVPGVTGVHTRAVEAWQARKGVCQDLAHLAAGTLRSIGIPTRYVSGYLHPRTTSAEIGVAVTGESHAWIEYWCGDWFGYDPTNLITPEGHHVVVGRGREYADVTPIRGVYAGGGASTQQVEVRITQET
jgi:transglutaminase-like putative cysteine protease